MHVRISSGEGLPNESLPGKEVGVCVCVCVGGGGGGGGALEGGGGERGWYVMR